MQGPGPVWAEEPQPSGSNSAVDKGIEVLETGQPRQPCGARDAGLRMFGEEHVGETPQGGVQGEEGTCARGPLAGADRKSGRAMGGRHGVGGHRREERRAGAEPKGLERGAKSSPAAALRRVGHGQISQSRQGCPCDSVSLLVCHSPPFTVPCSLGIGGNTRACTNCLLGGGIAFKISPVVAEATQMHMESACTHV